MELAQEIQKIRFLKICGLQPTVLVSQQKSNLIILMKTSWFTYKLYTTKVSIIASKVHHQWFKFFISINDETKKLFIKLFGPDTEVTMYTTGG